MAQYSAPYKEALRMLDTLITPAASLLLGKRHMPTALDEYRELLTALRMDDLNALHAIHVSGTKGKGSTCAYVESILRQIGLRTGFFSSPHVIDCRERVRINGEPISEEEFAAEVQELYALVSATGLPQPTYFRFLSLLAFRVFLRRAVDVAVIEVGIGGEYDCTNVIENPVVCGVTSLGMDHMSILGSTLPEIAWQKGGIFKRGAVAITAPQKAEAMEVLQARSMERSCPLTVSPNFTSYQAGSVHLGIPGQIQQENASLAIQLVRAWLLCTDTASSNTAELRSGAPLQPYERLGLESCSWLGRCQTLHLDASTTLYLDGAHTVESIEHCGQWFRDTVGSGPRFLIFTTTNDRPISPFLTLLLPCRFSLIVICLPRASAVDGQEAEANVRVKKLASHWKEMPNNSSMCERLFADGEYAAPTLATATHVDEALSLCRGHNGGGDTKSCVLVTGSLHLVGAVLSFVKQRAGLANGNK